MIDVGGNIQAVIQTKTKTSKNKLAEYEETWIDSLTLWGWLDLSAGDSKYTTYNAKVQESTHIFICDYQSLGAVTSENSRMIVNGQVYDILLIDNPMEMNEHYEIYLSHVGGEQNVN